MRRLERLIRDERGTLYEIPILVALVMMALAVGIPEAQKRGLGRGLLAALLVVGAVVGGFAALIFAAIGIGKVLESRPVQSLVGGGGPRKATNVLGWSLLALLMGAGGVCFAAVMADVFNASARATGAWTIGAGVVGLAAVAFAGWRSLSKKTPPAS